jgi:hypothetical protein
MKKFLISLMVILLLSACTPEPADMSWNGIALKTGAKCADEPPPAEDCVAGDVTALIEVDANGAPKSVSTIESCEDKKVTWKYEDDAFPNGDAPPFFIVFDPEDYPGKDPSKLPGSKPKPNQNNALNQELTINTRKMKNTPECINYMVVSYKGVLDPVFIIKR